MSEELFYLEDGKKADADLHDEMLRNPDADRVMQLISRNQALKVKAITPDDLSVLYRSTNLVQ